MTALNDARKRVIPGVTGIRPTYSSLAGIAGRLEAGKTAPECLAVIENFETAIKKGDKKGADFFDAVSPWRSENFERKLSMSAVKTSTASVGLFARLAKTAGDREDA